MLLFATPFWGPESSSSSWMEPVKTSRKMAAALLLFAFFDSFVHREFNFGPHPFSRFGSAVFWRFFRRMTITTFFPFENLADATRLT